MSRIGGRSITRRRRDGSAKPLFHGGRPPTHIRIRFGQQKAHFSVHRFIPPSRNCWLELGTLSKKILTDIQKKSALSNFIGVPNLIQKNSLTEVARLHCCFHGEAHLLIRSIHIEYLTSYYEVMIFSLEILLLNTNSKKYCKKHTHYSNFLELIC